MPEYVRVTLTRFRTSSHRLAIETGRWSRIPPEQRLCDCGRPQTEEHAICTCPLTANVRERFLLDYSDIARVLDNRNTVAVGALIFSCLKQLNCL